jgi:hypothetical protein
MRTQRDQDTSQTAASEARLGDEVHVARYRNGHQAGAGVDFWREMRV